MGSFVRFYQRRWLEKQGMKKQVANTGVGQ